MTEKPTKEIETSPTAPAPAVAPPGTLVGGYAPGEWRKFQRQSVQELRPWGPDVDMTKVSVSSVDTQAGSPKAGDWIARNPNDHADQWLVSARYFAENGFMPRDDVAARLQRVDTSLSKQLSEALATISRQDAEIKSLKEIIDRMTGPSTP